MSPPDPAQGSFLLKRSVFLFFLKRNRCHRKRYIPFLDAVTARGKQTKRLQLLLTFRNTEFHRQLLKVGVLDIMQ